MTKQQQTPQIHNEPLWNAYNLIRTYYDNDMVAKNNLKQTVTPFVKCMLDQLNQQQYSAYEKVGIYAAKEYWLQGEQELAPLLVRIGNIVESKITYRSPTSDNRMSAVTQVLAIDNDHFDDFPEFLETIAFAGLPVPQIQATVKKHFNFIAEL